MGSDSDAGSDKKNIVASGDDKDTGNVVGNEKTDDHKVTIEENTVLLDQDGIVITAKKLSDDSIWGLGVDVEIQNNSEKNLGIGCNYLIVNNYMISDLFSCSVAAGKKANDTIYLSSSELEAAGIDTIADILISFHVFDDNNYSSVFDSEEIEIKTSAYGTVEQPALNDGQELYNENGIVIVGKYVDEDSFWGAGILLYMENNSGQNVEIQCDNLSINGYMVMPLFSSTVNNGRMAIDSIDILSSDLEENDITSVEDVELTFQIINPDTYATIAETEAITFSVK
jgi:uncharacterized protein YacL (UPF0231 family)